MNLAVAFKPRASAAEEILVALATIEISMVIGFSIVADATTVYFVTIFRG